MGGLARYHNPNCDPDRMPNKPCPHCKYWPPMVAYRWRPKSRIWGSWCIACEGIAGAAYKRTQRGRAIEKRWRESEQGRQCRLAYQQTERAKAAREAYQKTPRARLLSSLRTDRYRLKNAETEAKREKLRRHMQWIENELARLPQPKRRHHHGSQRIDTPGNSAPRSRQAVGC